MTSISPPEGQDKLQVGDTIELIVSGVLTRVCGIDDSDNTVMDETGGWHSVEDVERVSA